MDVLITDHHEAADPSAVSAASVVINPKIQGSGYPFRDLAGVGVAYKLCQALTGSRLDDDLDLVALGTIADAVALTGENRVIAREGLLRIAATRKVGLQMLLESSGIKNKTLRPDAVSFILGPRINASGRMDTADVAFNLISSAQAHEARGFAREIEAFNRRRQKVENAIMEEAQDMIDREVNFRNQQIIVLAKDGWHLGVLGIVASKLVDRFNRPVILISMNETGCRGSGRSVRNFHLFNCVSSCRDLLENFGGHSHAIGMVIPRNNIGIFKQRVNEYARESMLIEDIMPQVCVDMELNLADITDKLTEELNKLEPFGEGNPKPMF